MYPGSMHRIVFLDTDTVDLEIGRPKFPHEWKEYGKTEPDQIIENLTGASIAVTNKVALRRKDLSQLPDLRLIAVAATGVDVIDLDYCREAGIAVSNIRNYAYNSVPEHVFMLILALRRNLISYRSDVHRGKWQQSDQFCLLDHPIHDLSGSKIGVVGYGSLGRGVAKLAECLGMQVLISEHKGSTIARPGRIQFEELLEISDIITLHCPLTDETRNFMGANEFRSMKRGALLINTARGGLVDEQALVDALRSGEIAGAGVDVLTEEPPKSGNPLLEVDLPNLIVTPHIAWASLEAQRILAEQLIENIEAFVNGTPQNLIV